MPVRVILRFDAFVGRPDVIRKVLFSQGAFPWLRQGMNTAELRHRVTATNIANALTPGYESKRVSFEEHLRDPESRVRLSGTQPDHMPSSARAVEPRVVAGEASGLPNGVSGVDVEQEMATLSRNRVQFRALASFATRQYRLLNQAIGRSRG
jgi:flagellar basal-body rod protein FlgB